MAHGRGRSRLDGVTASDGLVELHRVEGAAEESVVLVHGLGATARSFGRLLPVLSDHAVPVLVDLPRGAAVPDEAAALGDALDSGGVRAATVLGHSRGGAVAVALAERRPDLVSRLVLLGTPPTVASRLTARSPRERLLAVPGLGRVLWSLAPRAALRRGLTTAVARDTPVPDVLVDDLAATPHGAFVAASASLDDYLAAGELPPRLAALAPLPVDVVVGTDDRRVDPSSWREPDRPGVSLVRLEGVGHSPAWEAPHQVARILADGAGR
jgi:pimeloyl-ACP methyl ester carboxylesterase